MAAASPFQTSPAYEPRETLVVDDVELPAYFDDAAAEYERVRAHAGVFDRSDRGLLVATGADCKSWLHNLVTNVVQNLDDNTGNYAFAIDLRGRVQFDLNILSLPDALWLDLRAADVSRAKQHFERYLITESVTLAEATEQYARLAVAGPEAAEAAKQLGASHFPAMAALGSFALDDGGVRLVRHDFAGLSGFELFVARESAGDWWRRIVEDCGVAPAGQCTLDALRIEAGMPWSARDIDDQVIAPETGQVERGISYHKGCYLGQEVIERMRSRGSMARKLVGLRGEPSVQLTPPVPLVQNGKEIGRVTSWVAHPADASRIGLGYIRTNLASTDGIVTGDPPTAITIVNLTN